MALEISGPLQKSLRDIVPYIKERLSSMRSKEVDVVVIAKEMNLGGAMVDMFGTIHIDETIAMLEAITNNLKERKRLDKWKVGNDWT